MNTLVTYFFRHAHDTYFSIERLFKQITAQVNQTHPNGYEAREVQMPYTSKMGTIIRNILYASRNQSAVNHITGDIHYAILGCKKKHVNILTIHDCVALHRFSRSSLKFWILNYLWYKWPVKKADMVTVISENTRRELLEFTHCDPAKIRVIYNFVDPSFVYSPSVFQGQTPTILFIGTTVNKNLERMAEAIEGMDVLLDIVGPLTDQQLEVLNYFEINFRQSQRITDEMLMLKYRVCDIVAFPSTYEGFGLPIIEAQATGRPVLTSLLSPMQEVAGQGACLVDPFDTASIRAGIERIITDPAYRASIIQKGLENVTRFRLENITGQYADLYREILEKKVPLKNNHPSVRNSRNIEL